MLPKQLERVNLLPTTRPSSVGRPKKKFSLSDNATKVAAGGYMICSSLMLITNKLAVHNLPAPQFVLFAQLFTSGIPPKKIHFNYKNTSFNIKNTHTIKHYFVLYLVH